MDHDEDDRPGSLGDQVAWRLKRLREDRRLPYTELSERLSQLGRPIPVLGLRRIERGERRVDVDELVALAFALDVPPILLLFPVDHESWIEVVPDWVINTWDAARWFTGEATFLPDNPPDKRQMWVADRARAYWAAATPLVHLRQHESFVRRYANASRDDREREAVLDEWREVRSEIRRKGFTPPPMEGLLADIEDI